MLNIIERELTRKYYFLVRPFTLGGRRSAFSNSEPAGVDMSGSWDEVNIRRNDVNAYQDASKILTMIDIHQSKGSHVVDADNNVMLDLCSTENLPLGHNHDAFISVSHNR